MVIIQVDLLVTLEVLHVLVDTCGWEYCQFQSLRAINFRDFTFDSVKAVTSEEPPFQLIDVRVISI